ncbi:PilZ domain-containing protein [Thermodesulfobacteriota bacterium]
MEKRSEERILLDQYYSVDFLLKETGRVYQFKLRDLSPNGLGIFVREDSVVLQYLQVGDFLDVQFNPPAAAGPPEIFKTQIRHITETKQGLPDKHTVFGMRIIQRKPLGKQDG